MITKIPNNIKSDIKADVKAKFNTDIDDDIIDFIQDFQSKVAVEEGLAKKDTVRFYNLAVFSYNPKKVDSRNTMNRLLIKHNGDAKKALKEFRQLGKIISIEEENKKKHEKANRVPKRKRREAIKSVNGLFTAK